MKKRNHVTYSGGPDLRPGEFPDFEINFRRSILFALLQRKQLTREQYERCAERLAGRSRGG